MKPKVFLTTMSLNTLCHSIFVMDGRTKNYNLMENPKFSPFRQVFKISQESTWAFITTKLKNDLISSYERWKTLWFHIHLSSGGTVWFVWSVCIHTAVVGLLSISSQSHSKHLFFCGSQLSGRLFISVLINELPHSWKTQRTQHYCFSP